MLTREETLIMFTLKAWNILASSLDNKTFHNHEETREILDLFVDFGIVVIDHETKTVAICDELNEAAKDIEYKKILLSSDMQGVAQ